MVMISNIKNKALVGMLLAGEFLTGAAILRSQDTTLNSTPNGSSVIPKLDEPVADVTNDPKLHSDDTGNPLLRGTAVLTGVTTDEVRNKQHQVTDLFVNDLPSYLRAEAHEISTLPHISDGVERAWRNHADLDHKDGETVASLTLPINKVMAELNLTEVGDANAQRLLNDTSRTFPLILGKLLITPPEAVETSGQTTGKVTVMETATAVKKIESLVNLLIQDSSKFNTSVANEPQSFGSRFAFESASIQNSRKERTTLADRIRSHLRDIENIIGHTGFTAKWLKDFNARNPAPQQLREGSVQSLRESLSAER